MAKTLCPNCGYSPIPRGASECPSCEEPFDFLQTHKKGRNKFVDKNDSGEGEMTTFGGGLTGAVSAHPWPAAIVIALGAVGWFFRAAGLFTPADPPWTYGLVGLSLIAALLLVINAGPAKMIAQGTALALLVSALYLGRFELASFVTLAFVLHATIAFSMVLGEPSPVRRYLALGLGLMFSLLAAASLVLHAGKVAPVLPTNVEVDASALGLQLSLPQGFAALTAEQLTAALTVPPPSLTSGSAAFGDVKKKQFGVVTVQKMEEGQLVSSCRALHKTVGGRGEAEPTSHHAPSVLGSPSVVFRLKTATGATGLMACGKKPDGRLIALTVVQMSASDTATDALFDAVGAGLQLK